MNETLSYIAGVLHGDGWCTELTIGLRCADHDFASTFALALNTATGTILVPRFVEGRFWSVRSGNKSGRFDHLKDFQPRTAAEQAAWVRGLFDSEGNAQARPIGKPPRMNSIHRRVSMYSTEPGTLERAANYMANLGIETALRKTKNSAGHLGSKVVLELRVRRRSGFKLFHELIGSSIARKRRAIETAATSYLDPTAVARANQLKGAATKAARRVAAEEGVS